MESDDELKRSSLRQSSPTDRRTRVLSIFWAVLPILTLGILTWLVILFSANRLKSVALRWSALGWAAAAIVVFATMGSGQNAGAHLGVAESALIVTMLGGTFQAFYLRTQTFRLDSLDTDKGALRRALRIIRDDPVEAVRLNIGRIDIDARQRLGDGGLIDVNNSDVRSMVLQFGLSHDQETSLNESRQSNTAFVSASDFELRIGINPHVSDPFTGRIVCLPQLGSPNPNTQTSPTIGPGRADGRTSGSPITSASNGVFVASYIWALSPLLTGGLAAAPAIAFAAARLKSTCLWSISAAYLGIDLLIAYENGVHPNQTWNTIAQWALGAIVSAQAFYLRQSVFEVDVVRSDRQKRIEALRLVASDPQEAIRLQIGRADIPEGERYPDGGLIDLNNLDSAEMHKATGVDLETAKRIEEDRTRLHGFSSLNDLCNMVNIAPQLFDAVSDRVIFLPVYS